MISGGLPMSSSRTASLLSGVYSRLAYPPSPPVHAMLEPLFETHDTHTRIVLMLPRAADTFRLAGLAAPASVDVTFVACDADGREVHRSLVSRPPPSA